jgi:flagellar hook-associated protein 1
MAGLLNTAVSGLRAYQAALTTTSHNISNVNNDGYSRQTVDLTARSPQTFGSISVGQGVDLTSITRIVDEFNNTNIRDFQSAFSRLDMFNSFSSRVENIIADEQGSLMPALDNFFDAMNDVANDPSSNAPRVVLLGATDNLEQRFDSLSTELQQLSKEVDSRIVFEVENINALTTEIARVNDSITTSSSANAQPNDLYDQRDGLIRQLSEKLSVTVVTQTDGTLNVLAGTGQLLVTGAVSIDLSTQASAFQPDRLAVTLQSASGTSIDISNTISGGSLGGLMDFRNNMLDSAQNRLGRTAIALSDAVNSLHQQGYDLNGNMGAAYFSAGTPQVLDKTTNTGTAAVTVTISDATALTTSDYEVRFTAGNYSIVRLSDNATVAGPAAGPVFNNVDGLDFNIAGAANASDSFYVRPTRTGATNFQSLMTDTFAIAAAAPIRTVASSSNVGDSGVSPGTVLDATNANLLNTVTVTFNNPAGTFDVFDVTAGALIAPAGRAYTPGMTIAENGWQIQLTGNAPQPGDVLTIQENIGGSSDNRNALMLAGLTSQGVLDGGTRTFEQDYGALTAEVGGVAQQVLIGLEVEDSLLNNAVQERETISGVNLDEEAADLIRFQQAYQALARVIQTAQATFQSLLESV